MTLLHTRPASNVYRCWVATGCSSRYDGMASAREPLPFFLDPQQIEAMTAEIDWSRQVSRRIESFREFALRPVRLAA